MLSSYSMFSQRLVLMGCLCLSAAELTQLMVSYRIISDPNRGSSKAGRQQKRLVGQITFNWWRILPLVWHSQDAFSKTAAASLKPSQPFHRRHHKSLISPPRSLLLSPRLSISPFHLHPPASLPSTPFLFSLPSPVIASPSVFRFLFYPTLFSPLSLSRWIRCVSCCKEQTARGDLAPWIKRFPTNNFQRLFFTCSEHQTGGVLADQENSYNVREKK